jgi:predicted nucleic acid-binding protein
LTFVLDSSLAMAFVFQDEATAETDKILDSFGRGVEAIAPPLWRWEIGNALLMAERRKRLTPAETVRHLQALEMLPIEADEDASRRAWDASLLLARAHKLTLYDAAYLELATRRGFPLGSLDRSLRTAARAEGVRLLPERP